MVGFLSAYLSEELSDDVKRLGLSYRANECVNEESELSDDLGRVRHAALSRGKERSWGMRVTWEVTRRGAAELR